MEFRGWGVVEFRGWEVVVRGDRGKGGEIK